jgi:dTDP-4-amino-4,6-dideoxygalactose transaminase
MIFKRRFLTGDILMRSTFLPFAKPAIRDKELKEVQACLESGWLTTGPRVEKFEAALKAYFGQEHVITVSSATAGLHLALLTLKLQPGDEVITTAMTFVATLNTIEHAGGRPVLVDIDPKTYNMDLNQVERAITPRTRAIMPVHYAGAPVDLDALYALAEKHNLTVIEDCAHAMGTEYKGKRLGSFGHIQVFSFHPNKNMTTGEGGCIVTSDKDALAHMKIFRFHGIAKDSFNRYAKDGSPFYDVIAPGFKYNMMDIQAALGIHQLADLDQFIERRNVLAQQYHTVFKDWDVFTLPQGPAFDHLHAWHLYIPLLNTDKSPVSRDEILARMKDHNIGLGFHYQACHLFTYYKDAYGYKEGDFPHAEDFANRAMSLPLFPTMTDLDQQDVVEALSIIIKRF